MAIDTLVLSCTQFPWSKTAGTKDLMYTEMFGGGVPWTCSNLIHKMNINWQLEVIWWLLVHIICASFIQKEIQFMHSKTAPQYQPLHHKWEPFGY